jgi:hypothetical protein
LSTIAGFHVPVTPFEEVLGSTGTALPAQIVSEVPKLNKGVVLGVTVTVRLLTGAHKPGEGVKLYTAEFWLSIVAGVQLPVIPFVEVPGNTGTLAPVQISMLVPKSNMGVVFGLTVTVKLAADAHCPVDGVKL